jgi:seryl-tRNA synthetase
MSLFELHLVRYDVDNLRKDLGVISKTVAQKMKDSKGADKCEEEKAQANAVKEKIELAEKQLEEVEAERTKKLNTIGNLVHTDVPISKDEANNLVVNKWGEIPELKVDGKTLGHLHHHEIMQCLDMVEFERGQKIAGHRGYFLKGVGVLLNQALINYGLSFLTPRQYTPLQPPFFMKQSIMGETCQLSDFEESLYKVTGGKDEEPCFMVATSEQPISALHRNEWIDPTELPLRYAGISSCFRKEAGAHGKDVWGIFRVHQFEKVEQFCITTPEKSWEMHEEMIKIAEEFYRGLELPYQVINIVSGELNDAAAKKYDLEAWFPGYNAFRELVSSSNCTDYQSRGLDVRLQLGKEKAGKDKVFVHMLNATLCATERTMCCILENNQTPEGVKVPKCLQPFMGGMDFLPYNKKATEQFMEKKAKEDAKVKKK